MTTTVKVIGESNEATITIDPTKVYFGFECSKGAWCKGGGMSSPDLRLVIETASAHVIRHDDEDVARTGTAVDPCVHCGQSPCWVNTDEARSGRVRVAGYRVHRPPGNGAYDRG